MGQRVVAAGAVCLALAACTMGDLNLGNFGSFGGSGGVTEHEQMTPDIFGIRSSPNASNEDVLLKAAQTTRSVGGTHFKLISADDAGRPLEAASSGAAATSATIRPGQDTYIRVLRLAPGQEPPGGYFQADDIIATMGRRAKRG